VIIVGDHTASRRPPVVQLANHCTDDATTEAERGINSRPTAGVEQADWGAPRSKTITWHDPMVNASLAFSQSGLDFLQAIRDGRLPPPPVARLMGFSLAHVEYGLAVFECTPDESSDNPIGVVHGGLVCGP
jgi:hypothetical protein